jgi:hypothetical protein
VLRVLRVAALLGNLFVGLVGVVGLQNIPQSAGLERKFLMLGLMLMSLSSIVSIFSRLAQRPAYWVAMLMNAMVVVAAGFSFVGGYNAALVFLVPALLNMVTLEALRVVRSRLD